MEDILIENFYEDFKNAQTKEDKETLLEDFIKSGVDISDEDIKELKDQINDIIISESIEEDAIISMEIEDGNYLLYTCVTSIGDYKSGYNYYVKVDDPADFYKMTGIGETNTLIQNMLDSIKPIYYIILDDGIGTLKRKNIFPKSIVFSDYFTKFV
jgi:hypothetical protein